jgi:hypothetical protein
VLKGVSRAEESRGGPPSSDKVCWSVTHGTLQCVCPGMCVSTADMHVLQHVVAVSDPLWPQDTHGIPRWQLSFSDQHIRVLFPSHLLSPRYGHRLRTQTRQLLSFIRRTTLALPEMRAAWRRACVLVISRDSTTCIPRRTSRSPNHTLHRICRRRPDVEDMLRMPLERNSSPRFCWTFLWRSLRLSHARNGDG